MTTMLLRDSKGNKYPLFVVMKSAPSKLEGTRLENARVRHGFGKQVWAEISLFQDRHGMKIYGNQSTWWNGEKTLAFLRYHFGERSLVSEPMMRLLDDFSGHWMLRVQAYAIELNVTLMKIPQWLTWLCQPADAVWIKPLKDRLRRHWVDFAPPACCSQTSPRPLFIRNEGSGQRSRGEVDR